MPDSEQDTESLYRKGMALWAERSTAQASELLEKVLARSGGPHDPWWFAASRALAQIAMESDDLDLAERHLRMLPGLGIGDAQQLALRARRAMLEGDHHASSVAISAAVQRLAADDAADVGSLMNGAIAFAWCAEVLVELGYGEEASRLIDSARQRVAEAAVDDPMLSAILAMGEAQAARLLGDDTASARLAKIDITQSPDLGILVTRERARTARDADDTRAADAAYAAAIESSKRLGYVALTRLIAMEKSVGPITLRTDPDPVERWAMRSMGQNLAGHRPYAVVVRLILDDDPERFLELEREVSSLLGRLPSLGIVDGTGSDGEAWELFLDGDHADPLWAAIRPLVEAVNPAAGSQVVMRRGEETHTIPVT